MRLVGHQRPERQGGRRRGPGPATVSGRPAGAVHRPSHRAELPDHRGRHRPAAPKVLAQLPTVSAIVSCNSLAVAGNTLIIAQQTDKPGQPGAGARIYDVSDPARPVGDRLLRYVGRAVAGRTLGVVHRRCICLSRDRCARLRAGRASAGRRPVPDDRRCAQPEARPGRCRGGGCQASARGSRARRSRAP